MSDSGEPPKNADSVKPARATRGVLRVIVRVFFAMLAAALLVGGGLFLRAGFLLRAECREAEVAVPLDVLIDVSKVGVHRAKLKQVSAISCKQYISMEPVLQAGEDAKTLLDRVMVTVLVEDAEGREWLSGAHPNPYAHDEGVKGVVIASASPRAVGEYQVEIDVVSPEPKLAGRPVRFVSRYALCGIEWMGVYFGIGIGVVCVVPGVIIAGVLWVTRRRAAALGGDGAVGSGSNADSPPV